MTTAKHYPTASQILHTLRSKGYKVSCSDYVFNEELGTWNVYIMTPQNTLITAVHMQWLEFADDVEGGVFDALRVKRVQLPSGEVCKGVKYCRDRHDMLVKKVMA